ncbi:MAG: hypothetical protein GY714_20920 [Desulfobacterales bacterium]|nr:hypothetical protein [Desulfobacterales bacterium]
MIRIKRIGRGNLCFSTRSICSLRYGEITEFPTNAHGMAGVKLSEIKHLIKDRFFDEIEKPISVSGTSIPKGKKKK